MQKGIIINYIFKELWRFYVAKFHVWNRVISMSFIAKNPIFADLTNLSGNSFAL